MKTILLLEDDIAIRHAIRLGLQHHDYNLIEMESGEEILQNQISAPDVFILDRRISGTDGLDVCRYIKSSSKYASIPVIMISANPDIVKLASDAGADAALTKPFSLRKLREVIAGCLIE